MNPQEITLKGLSLDMDESTMSLEQIDKCFHSMKEGRIICYQQKQYIYVLAGELLCALHQNGDITTKVLSEAFDSHYLELQEIETKREESEPMSEIRQRIADDVPRKKNI